MPLRCHLKLMRAPGIRFVAMLLLCAIGLPARRAAAQDRQRAIADVVVIVDTSISMRDAGMDPERASLLVTRLLADIVPGNLAVVRLLDIDDDRDVIPSRPTGQTVSCQEDPTRTCHTVEPAGDWEEAARTGKLGALVRPVRGDAAYKQVLPQHLEQRVNNSMFSLAFRAAQGILEGHRKEGGRPAHLPRTVIWLSDGRSDGPEVVRHSIRELVAEGVVIEAMVFGRGDTQLATSSGLQPRRVSTPAEIMKAFAGAFRRIVEAPYEIDNTVSVQPAFEMKPNVDEAWIVAYGDASLGEVTLQGPGQTVRANYAADRWESAGAYKVAYLEHPAAGRWTVHATGGGPGVAYAVVQRSALAPVLLAPKRTLAGAPVRMMAGISAGRNGALLVDPALLRDVSLTAEFQGQTVTLLDNGARPDQSSGDGRFSASATFRSSGKVPVRLRLRSPMVDRVVDTIVEVSGSFHYTGGPVDVDFGTLGVETEVCKPLTFSAQYEGDVPFELRALKSLPAGHTLTVRLPSGKLLPSGNSLTARSGDKFEVCLATSRRAPSSTAAGEPWLALQVAESEAADQRVPIRARWTVNGLSFWQRWGWLILLILGIVLVAIIAGGFILPQRFQGGLAVVFVPERAESRRANAPARGAVAGSRNRVLPQRARVSACGLQTQWERTRRARVAACGKRRCARQSGSRSCAPSRDPGKRLGRCARGGLPRSRR